MAVRAIVFDAYGTLYDVQSVARITDAAFPGRGDYITQVWRLKQLEYTWLRSLMGRYADFWTITQDALRYTLNTLGLSADERLFEKIVEAYNNLELYPDAKDALAALNPYRLAILSNGSPDMLNTLVRNSGLDGVLEATLSIHGKRMFKPNRAAYEVVEEALRVEPVDVVFVSSNGFDVAGAKSFGFKVAAVQRVSAAVLQQELRTGGIGPQAMYKALRMQAEQLGVEPDIRVAALADLPGAVAKLAAAA